MGSERLKDKNFFLIKVRERKREWREIQRQIDRQTDR